MKSNFYLTTFLFSCILLANSSRGQTSTFFEVNYKPVVVWVYPPDIQREVYQKMSDLTEVNRNKYRFLLISDTDNSKTVITKKINDFLNNEPTIDIQRVYVLEWSRNAKSKYFENTNKDIIADFSFHQIKENSVIFNLEDVLKQFDRNYVWHITLSQIEEKSLLINPQLRKFSYGLTFGTVFLKTFKEDTAYLPPSIAKLGFTVGYRINPRLFILSKGQFSFDIPDMSNTQSTLFKQINISKGGIQKVKVDANAHVFLQGSIQANYFLGNSQKFKPFVGAGLTYLNFRSAKIRKEVEVDIDKILSGGGQPAGLSADEANFPFTTESIIQPFITGGISYKLFKNVSLMVSAEYYYNGRKEWNGVSIDNKNENFSINGGIQFEFKKKQKKYYQYFGGF
jgi:opacity protein-like surface antigen